MSEEDSPETTHYMPLAAHPEVQSNLLDMLADSVIVHKVDGTILYVNRAACEIRGYSREELLRTNLFTLSRDISPEKGRRLISRIVTDGSHRFEVTGLRKDGTTFIIEVHASALAMDREPVILSVSRNVTERRKAEEELAAAKELLVRSTDGIQEGLMLLTNDFRIEWANRAAVEQSGRDPSDVIGNFCYTVSHGRDLPCSGPDDPCPMIELKRTGQPVRMVHNHVDAKGVVSFIEVSAYPARSEEGIPIEFIHVARDITRNILDERELRRLNSELEAFNYSVSHDLRSPLQAILSFSETVSKNHSQQLDPAGQKLLDLVVRNAEHMSTLIEALLDLSRLSRQPLATGEIDMQALATEVWEELKASIQDRSIDFHVGSLPPAHGDEVLIRQVLFNLLSNAVKFTARRDKASISVDGWSDDCERVFSVKDNGVGFNPDYSDRLFKAFKRLHADDDFEGTGVGLANVSRIVERFGGRAWAESRPGEGATFFFSLPADGRTKGSVSDV